MDVDEGSIRRLQRIAFGAGATPDERERAVTELARLAVLGTRHDTASAGGAGERSSSVAGATYATDTSNPPHGAPGEHVVVRRRLLRWTLAAGGIGLLVGAVLGWGAGQRAPLESALPATAGESESEEVGTPLADTDLLRVFDRLPPAAESTRVASVDDAIDPTSVRLLATRVDGPAAHLARTIDGENVCLVLLMPVGPSRIECTVDGRLPADGLQILYGAEGYGLAAAELDQTGTVSLGLVGPS
ncbi:MAG: hypothetical protein M3Y52_05130 [Actinomycetota bacterium]|nr:hypothetical protein [Actinomycetota bacterium]